MELKKDWEEHHDKDYDSIEKGDKTKLSPFLIRALKSYKKRVPSGDKKVLNVFLHFCIIFQNLRWKQGFEWGEWQQPLEDFMSRIRIMKVDWDEWMGGVDDKEQSQKLDDHPIDPFHGLILFYLIYAKMDDFRAKKDGPHAYPRKFLAFHAAITYALLYGKRRYGLLFIYDMIKESGVKLGEIVENDNPVAPSNDDEEGGSAETIAVPDPGEIPMITIDYEDIKSLLLDFTEEKTTEAETENVTSTETPVEKVETVGEVGVILGDEKDEEGAGEETKEEEDSAPGSIKRVPIPDVESETDEEEEEIKKVIGLSTYLPYTSSLSKNPVSPLNEAISRARERIVQQNTWLWPKFDIFDSIYTEEGNFIADVIAVLNGSKTMKFEIDSEQFGEKDIDLKIFKHKEEFKKKRLQFFNVLIIVLQMLFYLKSGRKEAVLNSPSVKLNPKTREIFNLIYTLTTSVRGGRRRRGTTTTYRSIEIPSFQDFQKLKDSDYGEIKKLLDSDQAYYAYLRGAYNREEIPEKSEVSRWGNLKDSKLDADLIITQARKLFYYEP